MKNLITYHDFRLKNWGLEQGAESLEQSNRRTLKNAKTGFKGTSCQRPLHVVNKQLAEHAGNVTRYQTSNRISADKTQNSTLILNVKA